MEKRLTAAAVWARTLRGLVLVSLGAGFALSVFSSPADIARGLAWLQAQVRPDGSLAGPSQTAAPAQASCETAKTLLKLAGNSGQVSSLLASLPGPHHATETLGCWQQLRVQLGQTVLATELDARRVSALGWAPYEGFGIASAVDSGPALLAQLRLLPSGDKATVLAWLQSVQAPEGSFAIGGRPDLLATATILRGLQDEAAKSTGAAAIATKAAAWLLAQRDPVAGWASDVAITSIVYEAAHPYTGTDANIASSIESYLLSQQLGDGSWAGDPYVTAVALRALTLTAVAPIDPTAGSSAVVRGSARDAGGQALPGVAVQVQPAAGPAKTATTDSTGKYQISGIAPGPVTLVASLAGYQSVTAQASLQAGGYADFSPTLYPVGSTIPSGARLRGKVLAYGTNAPLPGVTVQASGASPAATSTDGQGSFDLSVAAGAYAVNYALTGYTTVIQQVVLPAGATADAGVVLLKPVPTISALRGAVTDLAGAPIAGATVAVQGGPSATTNSSGAYSLSGVDGLQFTIQASAAGYATRAIAMSVPQAGDYVQDVKLPGLSAGYLSISNLALSNSSVGLRGDITASLTVSNPSGSAAAAVVGGQVIDPQGRTVASLAGVNGSGVSMGTLTLQPGESQSVALKWNSSSAAPGNYTFVGQLVLPDSITYLNPQGTVLDSRQAAFSITGGASFIGSITANPPVLRAGTNTAVKLSALIQNDGNVALPAQDYQLAAVDTKTGQTAMTQRVSSDALPVQQLRSLAFSAWTPQVAGNFRLELTAVGVPGVKVTAPLYVGDSSTALFAVDRNQVPAGDQKVRGTITVTGQSVANGTINDPLVPLVKAAINRAVKAADNYANGHYPKTTNCFACHVQTQAVVGGERNLKYLAPENPLTRAVLMANITQSMGNEGDTSMTQQGPTADAAAVLYRDGPGNYKITNTTLGLWAATQWHDANAVNYSKVRMANFLLKNQLSDGSWTPDHGTTWWATKAPLAALNAGSLSALKATLASQNFPFGKKLVPYSVPGLPSGEMHMTADPATGTMYVTFYEGQVWAVPSSGSPSVVVNGLKARSAWPLGDGRLLVGADSGVYIRETSGALTRISTVRAWEAQPWTNGNFLVTLWGGSALYVLTPTGSISALAADSRLGSTLGFTVMPDGSVVAYSNQSPATALRFSPTGQLLDAPIPSSPLGGLVHSTSYKGGLLLSTNVGLFYYNKDWVAERWTHERIAGLLQLPDGRLLVNYKGALYEVQDNAPVDAAAIDTRIDSAMAKVSGWLKAGAGVNANNNIDLAFRLIGLGNVKAFYKGTPGESSYDSLMQSIGATLRARQKAAGGWIWREGIDPSTSVDPMVTAIVGIALDNLNPSKDSPEVRNAIQYLLSAQSKNDDMWRSVYAWNNGAGLASEPLLPSTWVEIWLPTMLERLGGIDTDLSVTFPPNVAMSNPDKQPTATTVGADGSTTYVWKLTGVTETSQQVNFDATLKGMQVDETRALAQSASLAFKNSFVDGNVTAQIDVPKVAVGTSVTQALSTSKPSYTDTEQAVFTSAVTNAGTAVRDVQVRFTVIDAAGQVVDVLPPTAIARVPGASTVPIQASWPATGVLSGAYQVKSQAMSPAGVLYSTATANFNVTSSGTQADGARIGTDRVAYNNAQTVQLTSRISNLTVSALQENLQAVTVVTGSASQNVFSQTEAIDQLAPSTQRQFVYSLAGSALPAGAYQADLKLIDAQGRVLAQSTTTFNVLGTDETGIGLTGQVQALPSVVILGQPVALNLAASNNGGAALANAPVTLRIIEPASGAVLATFDQTIADWAAGSTQAMNWNWIAQGVDGQILVVAASVKVAGRDVPLGQANVRLVGVPKLAADPTQLDFATVYVGERPAGQTVTVTSVGTAAAKSLTTALAGMDPSQFVITQNSCDQASLSIGASCKFTVSYQPTQVARHAAQVTVGAAGAETVIVPVTGQAKPVIFAGTVASDAAQVEAGSSIALSYSITNPAQAEAAMEGSLQVLTASGQVLASWPVSATLAAGASYAGNQSFTTPLDAQTLTVRLVQQVAENPVVLATHQFTVTDPPVPVGTSGATKGQARVLVLLSCPPGLGTAEDAACVQARKEAITNYLTALGYANQVVTTGEEFLAQMRCGTYNTYWLSGGAIKLSAQTAEELREAIWRGEALWTDGLHDSRNSILYEAQGVTQIGKLPVANQSAALTDGGIYGAGSFATLGQITKFALTTGQPQGQFSQVPGEQAPVAAVIANSYGQGNSLLFAFDLAAMITADASRANAALASFVIASAGYAASASPTLTIGDLALLDLAVANQGTRTVTLQVQAALPAGLTSITTAPNAQITARSDGSVQATWTYSAAAGSTQSIEWQVRAAQPGSYNVPYQVYSLPGAGGTAPPRLRASGSIELVVKDTASLLQQAQAQVGALQPTASADKSNKTKAEQAIAQALGYHGQGNYEAAIVQWLAAADAIEAITSVDVSGARTAVSMALEATTDAACIQKCGSAACQ